MAAAREYGHAGTVGITVPQANTTVEAEFRALALPGVNIVTARLQGSRSDSRTRLLDYFHGLDATLDTFDTAPLGAVGFACTGSSYLLGVAQDRAAEPAADDERAPGDKDGWTARLDPGSVITKALRAAGLMK